MSYGGIFDYAQSKDRQAEVELELADPAVWEDADRAQRLGRERSSLELIVKTIETLEVGLGDADEMVELAAEEDDEELMAEVTGELDRMTTELEVLEFRRRVAGEMDRNNAYVDIQAGSGGTEAQDWAEMLLRKYLRWGEN